MTDDSPARSSCSWWSWGWRRRRGCGARSARGGRWPGSASSGRGRSSQRRTWRWANSRIKPSKPVSRPSRDFATRCWTNLFRPETSPWHGRWPSATAASSQTRKRFKRRSGRSRRWSAGRGRRPNTSGSRPASPNWHATLEPGRMSRAGSSWRPPTTRRPGTSVGSRSASWPAALRPARAPWPAATRLEATALWPRRSTGPARSIRGICGW